MDDDIDTAFENDVPGLPFVALIEEDGAGMWMMFEGDHGCQLSLHHRGQMRQRFHV